MHVTVPEHTHEMPTVQTEHQQSAVRLTFSCAQPLYTLNTVNVVLCRVHDDDVSNPGRAAGGSSCLPGPSSSTDRRKPAGGTGPAQQIPSNPRGPTTGVGPRACQAGISVCVPVSVPDGDRAASWSEPGCQLRQGPHWAAVCHDKHVVSRKRANQATWYNAV